MKVMEAARAKKEVVVEGKRVSILRDFSVEVQKKRAESADARSRLRDARLKYPTPTIMNVFDALGGSTTLSSLEEAENFLKNIQQQSSTSEQNVRGPLMNEQPWL